MREQGKGAALFGYTKLYGQVPGGQAEYLRVPEAQYGPIVVPAGPPDDRFVYLSDVLPTAWQAVEYADVPEGGTLAVYGLGPIGQMALPRRAAPRRGAGLRHRPRARAARAGAPRTASRPSTCASTTTSRPRSPELTDGRGPGLRDRRRRHGGARRAASASSPRTSRACCPTSWPTKLIEKAGVDRLSVLHAAIDTVRRGGTLSIVGVYGGMIDPMPMMTLFDKQITVRMGQANVKRWVDDILPLLTGDDDPLGVDDFATHRLPLSAAPDAYADFQAKRDGAIKILLQP